MDFGNFNIYRVDVSSTGAIRGISRVNTAFHVTDVEERKVFGQVEKPVTEEKTDDDLLAS